MKCYAKTSFLAPALSEQLPGARYRTGTFGAAPAAASKRFYQCETTETGWGKAEAALIYVVDDEEGLTELYSHFLKGAGCMVRAFNRRASALSALAADSQRPDLLVMDYLGHDMPAERFMLHCLGVHPSLRILMASGLSQSELPFSQVRPHRFLQKPFTAEEFLLEVRAALAE